MSRRNLNFGGDEVVYDYSGSRIIIVPVPYDRTSTWIRGADRGPDAIMEASANLEFYDVETSTEVHLLGIHTVDPVPEEETPEKLVDAVCRQVLSVIDDGKFPVIVGGNHTVSIGAVKAFACRYDDMSVLQLDAHSDLRDEYEGSRYNHACAMARAREYAPLVQAGIRSMSAGERRTADMDRIFFAHELYSDKNLYSKAAGRLSGNVYITIDLDVFDPSLIPSTGTPEPGGPGDFEIRPFLRQVMASRNVIGFDIVELCPSPSNKAPDFVAAKIIYQLLSYKFSGLSA